MRRAGVAAMPPAPEIDIDRSHAFRSAKRHSRRVRFLRWLLPATALAGAFLILLYVWLDPLRFYYDLPVDFGRISISDNKLTIEAPKLTGFTQDRRPYSVTAREAAQDLTNPNRIELGGIVGQVELADGGETKLEAGKGVYDMKTGTLLLSEGIRIGATGGYRVELYDALMHVRAGRIVTTRPVEAVFPDGTLAANRLEIADHGDNVKFDGGVRMTFRMPEETDGAGRAASADINR